MPGPVPGIHVLGAAGRDVDGRDKPGHDGDSRVFNNPLRQPPRLQLLHQQQRRLGQAVARAIQPERGGDAVAAA